MVLNWDINGRRNIDNRSGKILWTRDQESAELDVERFAGRDTDLQ